MMNFQSDIQNKAMLRRKELESLDIQLNLHKDFVLDYIECVEEKVGRELTKDEIADVILHTIGYVNLQSDDIIDDVIELCELLGDNVIGF